MVIYGIEADDWRFPRLNRVVHNINTARKLNKFTDVTFIVGRDEDACTIKAHRVVLGTANAELAKLVSGSEKPLRIRIEDVSAKGFKNMIRFLYDIDVKFTDFSTVRETLVVAEKYKVHKLRLAAENYLNCNVKYGPVLEILELSLQHDLPKLKMTCIDNISTKYQELLQSEELASSSFEVLYAILSIRPCCGDECQSQALLAISNWMKKHEANRELLERLLQCVDLTRARTDFDASDQEKLLSTEDLMALEKYKVTKNVSDAPVWYRSSKYVVEKMDCDSDEESEKNDDPSRKRTFSENMRLQKAKVRKACDEELQYIRKRIKLAADETLQQHNKIINRTVDAVMTCFGDTLWEGVETALECYEDDMNTFIENEGEKNEEKIGETESGKEADEIVSPIEIDKPSKNEYYSVTECKDIPMLCNEIPSYIGTQQVCANAMS